MKKVKTIEEKLEAANRKIEKLKFINFFQKREIATLDRHVWDLIQHNKTVRGLLEETNIMAKELNKKGDMLYNSTHGGLVFDKYRSN